MECNQTQSASEEKLRVPITSIEFCECLNPHVVKRKDTIYIFENEEAKFYNADEINILLSHSERRIICANEAFVAFDLTTLTWLK
mmetsp:Transcript_32833/g.37590  ORF Transcript_32833/g.37590 Transcript_32833/m.37590 type:complete len:85 (+) Transcript_32833:1060-1314(+)